MLIDCHEQFLEEHYEFHLCFSIKCCGLYCYFVCWHPVLRVMTICPNAVYMENGEQDIFARKVSEAHFQMQKAELTLCFAAEL